MASEPTGADERATLVTLLQEAARLEHCLMASYLYSACSLRSTPSEFAAADGRENRRRAIQFERSREWKGTMLAVAREEMMHLHYVQCLLRAIGEPPHFTLPDRNDEGSWQIGSWKARIGDQPAPERGTAVPVKPLSVMNARRFVLYESTDALQSADPFGPEVSSVFDQLYALERELRLAQTTHGIRDPDRRQELEAGLRDLEISLLPVEPRPEPPGLALMRIELEVEAAAEVEFQSIAELYEEEILPRYREAFERGWVRNTNENLNDELLDPDKAGAGLLPIGPIYRDKNFEAAARRAQKNPLDDYMDVAAIIGEIADEGEGATEFLPGAAALLADVEEIGGPRAYLDAVIVARDPHTETPKWIEDGERLRFSHLYRFAMLLRDLEHERDLARDAGIEFDPVREEVAAGVNVGKTLAEQFNAVYVVLVAWLARFYEVPTWDSDMPRRKGLEMIASWPLMSIAVRPFLELSALCGVKPGQLFRLEQNALPEGSPARKLRELLEGIGHTQQTNDEADRLAVEVLREAATWAEDALADVVREHAPNRARSLITRRLEGLVMLREFERQYPYRIAGGYAEKPPTDADFRRREPDGNRYEEAPQSRMFRDSHVLRLRFAGRGLVQCATDPDSPRDEAGCSGTHFLHASDGERVLDRSLVWQPEFAQHAIRRGPDQQLPPLGVQGVEVALLAADGPGEKPIDGLRTIDEWPLDELLPQSTLRIDLDTKHGQTPYLFGDNHLVWRDGEPIDPFILAATLDRDGERIDLLRREVFNDGVSLANMTPLQRALSGRGPLPNIWRIKKDGKLQFPDWVISILPESFRSMLEAPAFPRNWLEARTAALADALAQALEGSPTSQKDVDAAISYAARRSRFAVPRGTTVAWLGIGLDYRHSLSGAAADTSDPTPLLAAVGEASGHELRLAEPSRALPNGRWYVSYTKANMDTDALSDLVYGELFIPVVSG